MKIFGYKFQTLKNSVFIKDIISNGWKPYMVGGCCRDYLMNLKPNDIDIIVVGCDSEELIKLLKKYGKTDLVGESFGVIKFHYKGEIYDISTPRKEKKIGNSHRGFEIITNKNISLEDDLSRRDITINSIAMDFDGNFIDPFGGINDIKNKIIRITNPEAFLDDPLRILRCCRFCSRFDFNIDKETSKLMMIMSNRIKDLSQERIWEEIKKSFEQSKNFNKYLDLLTNFNMWEQMFPGSNINTKTVESDNFIIIISNLFKNEDINGLAEKMIHKYKIKSDISVLVVFLISLLKFDPDNVLQYYRKKEQIIESIIKGVESDREKNRRKLNDLIFEWFKINNIKDRILLNFINYTPTVSSKYLISKGFHGHMLGSELKRLEKENFLKM